VEEQARAGSDSRRRPLPGEELEDDHLAAAAERADARCGRRERIGRSEGHEVPTTEGVAPSHEQSAGVVEEVSAGGRPEAVGTDLDESAGQDVLEEAGEEVVKGQRAPLGDARLRLDVSEGDAVVVGVLDGGVGDGDAEEVAGEVAESRLAAARAFDVGDPGHAPDAGRDTRQEAGVTESGPDPGSQAGLEDASRQEEAGVRGLAPDEAIESEAAGRDEHVDVRVEDEGPDWVPGTAS